jgi:hypothetical protein
MGTATAVALGIGGALALYLLFKRSEAPATKPAPCFTNIGGVPVPCDVVSGLSSTIFNGLGAIAKNPSAILPFHAIAETFSDGFGSHNSCPPGTTDKGWRGCLDGSGNVVGRGPQTPLTPAQSTLITGLGGSFGSVSGFAPTAATAPITPAKWSPRR